MVVITVTMKIEEGSCDGSLVSRFAFVRWMSILTLSALDHQSSLLLNDYEWLLYRLSVSLSFVCCVLRSVSISLSMSRLSPRSCVEATFPIYKIGLRECLS